MPPHPPKIVVYWSASAYYYKYNFSESWVGLCIQYSVTMYTTTNYTMHFTLITIAIIYSCAQLGEGVIWATIDRLFSAIVWRHISQLWPNLILSQGKLLLLS